MGNRLTLGRQADAEIHELIESESEERVVSKKQRAPDLESAFVLLQRQHEIVGLFRFHPFLIALGCSFQRGLLAHVYCERMHDISHHTTLGKSRTGGRGFIPLGAGVTSG
jgi:hypothetical protein